MGRYVLQLFIWLFHQFAAEITFFGLKNVCWLHLILLFFATSSVLDFEKEVVAQSEMLLLSTKYLKSIIFILLKSEMLAPKECLFSKRLPKYSLNKSA